MMVMPSGRRSSRARAGRDHQRQRAEQGGERRHQDRPEAREAGLVDRALGRQPALALASSAKSTSMMPFFFTMPISRMMPMKAIMRQLDA